MKPKLGIIVCALATLLTAASSADVQHNAPTSIVPGQFEFTYVNNRQSVSEGWPVKSYEGLGRCEGGLTVTGFGTAGFFYSPAWLIDWAKVAAIQQEGWALWFHVPLKTKGFFTFLFVFPTPDAAAAMRTAIEPLRASCYKR